MTADYRLHLSQIIEVKNVSLVLEATCLVAELPKTNIYALQGWKTKVTCWVFWGSCDLSQF